MPNHRSEIRCVLSAHAINGESPAWCPQESVLYWIDVKEPAVHRFYPATGRDQSWLLPSWVGCAVPGGDGEILLALREGIGWLDCANGSLHMLAPVPFDPRQFFSNDGKCDPQGRFWFGPMYQPLAPAPAVEPDASPLLRFDADTRRCVPQTHAVNVSNGIAWSADGRTMYHSDAKEKTIYAYEFDGATGSLLGRSQKGDGQTLAEGERAEDERAGKAAADSLERVTNFVEHGGRAPVPGAGDDREPPPGADDRASLRRRLLEECDLLTRNCRAAARTQTMDRESS